MRSGCACPECAIRGKVPPPGAAADNARAPEGCALGEGDAFALGRFAWCFASRWIGEWGKRAMRGKMAARRIVNPMYSYSFLAFSNLLLCDFEPSHQEQRTWPEELARQSKRGAGNELLVVDA